MSSLSNMMTALSCQGNLGLTEENGGRALFILDGLDEVSQDLNGDSDIFRFLVHLLNQRKVIITSRPHGTFPGGLKSFDLELETIGFSPRQVDEYVEKTFDSEPETFYEIQQFLDTYALVQGVVQIPIQLDALCFPWGHESTEAMPHTMTGIYQRIENSLWKKDVIRLAKRDNGELITRHHLEESQLSVEALVEDEVKFLECLAFTGLHNDAINFDFKCRDFVDKHFGFSK